MSSYDHLFVEQKWQNIWDNKQYHLNKIDLSKPKYYILEMLPYPSGMLHMGHVRNYSLGDAFARFKKSNGFNILHPMGWDSFGLPAENAAIENNSHPLVWTEANITNMKCQLKSIGLSYDWNRELSSCSPDYYKHEQELFLQFLANGIAYQKESFVNWDPVDNTVLANEQVVDGKGWRSGAIVEKKKLNQWFLKISEFAEDLLPSNSNLKNWPEAVKAIQEKWIGKSKGAIISFKIPEQDAFLDVFTTRADTLFGASFIVISPHHPLVETLSKSAELKNFLTLCDSIGTAEEAIEKADKIGFFTGLTALHPFNSIQIPIYIANYVLLEYGTVAVFGCPAHDERDHQFAVKYKLPIIPVVDNGIDYDYQQNPYIGDGIICNSEFLNGLTIGAAKKASIAKLIELNAGREFTTYRLRDWGISRQRYWGCPIPIIYCKSCGTVPVDKKDLPVKLPDDIEFTGGNPLEKHLTWKFTNCPKCDAAAIRETDTFDTFFESSWYFLRYCSANYTQSFADSADIKYWLPVDQYIGGIEHAAMHLLYARFFIKAMKKLNLVDFDEPFDSLLTQGMVLHKTFKDQNGKWIHPEEAAKISNAVVGRVEKMSKSKKNTVSPIEIIKQYGADTARLFMLSDTPPAKDLEWSSSGVEAANRYLGKLWRFVDEFSKIPATNYSQFKSEQQKTRSAVHKLLKQISDSYNALALNVAVAGIRELSNIIFAIEKTAGNYSILAESINILLIIIFPITPHIAEELWQIIGNKTSLEETKWPKVIPELLVDQSVTIAVQVSGKLRATIEVPNDISNQELEKIALEESNIVKYIDKQVIKKIIIVPNKIINIVI